MMAKFEINNQIKCSPFELLLRLLRPDSTVNYLFNMRVEENGQFQDMSALLHPTGKARNV
jgi:hypothetical protein